MTAGTTSVESPAPGAIESPALLVADLMSWPALRVDPECSADQAFSQMREFGVSHLLVTMGQVPLGIVCEVDAAAAGFAAVAEIARRPHSVSLWDPAMFAAGMLWSDNLCAVAVRVPGRACGLLTRDDLTRAGVSGPWPRCESCGSHHRVRSQPDVGVAFCAECLDGMQPFDLDDLYGDLGVAD
jgi:hypothetical protein